MLTEFVNWIWDFFANAGAVANAFEIVGTIVATLSAAWLYMRRAREGDQAVIADLEGALERRKQTISTLTPALDSARETIADLETRLASTALQRAIEERAQGNDDRANNVLRDWVTREGASVAELLMHQARWAVAHSTIQPVNAFIVAEGYAIAATALQPQIRGTLEMVDEIRSWLSASGEWTPPLRQAIPQWSSILDQPLTVEQIIEARSAFADAQSHFTSGRYHLALPLAEHALALHRRLASETLETASARDLCITLMDFLGQWQDQVTLSKQQVEALEGDIAVGPDHPSTMRARVCLAIALSNFGKKREAGTMADHLLRISHSHVAFSPDSPGYLGRRYALGLLLQQIERLEDALPVIRSVVDAVTDGMLAINAERVLADILCALGREDEALSVVEPLVAKAEDFGTDHPEVIFVKKVLAEVLRKKGRLIEALRYGEQALGLAIRHSAFGPNHYDTLRVQLIVGLILSDLGRGAESAKLCRAVLEALAVTHVCRSRPSYRGRRSTGRRETAGT